MKPVVVVAGALAQRPGYGGHAWVFLQYLLGFRRLGFDVLFVDRIDASMCVDERGQRCSLEASVNLRYLVDVMAEFGLADSFALLSDHNPRIVGMGWGEVVDRARRSVLLLNVMGHLDDPEIRDVAPNRVFLDIDPGFGQMWRELGLADMFSYHDHYVTIGHNIGRADCTIPTGGIDWLTTRPPVVLEQWPDQPVGGSAVTTVGSWRGPFGPIEYGGETYGLRVHEFRRFVDLPHRTGFPMEAALDIDPADSADAEALQAGGWGLVDPHKVASDPAAYRWYLQGSRAEFMVAKNMYVRSRSGWFSDRSVCYLASGKPVLAQDTGTGEAYPIGEGLLTFSTPDQARVGIEQIQAEYPRHAAAARRIAADHFDSDKVLGGLLDQLGVG